MTNEWVEWFSDNRIKTSIRGNSNNFFSSYQCNKISGMGLKTHTIMKSLQKPRGLYVDKNLKCKEIRKMRVPPDEKRISIKI